MSLLLQILVALSIALSAPTARAAIDDGSDEMAYAWDVIKDVITSPFTRGVPEPNNPLHVPYHYFGEQKLKLDGRTLGLCMALETPAAFTFDKVQMHCPIKKQIDGRWTATVESDKLPTFVSYVGADTDRTCDYSSGQEPALDAWILTQPDNSLHPLPLYEKALELSGGNIWTALLTVHNVLRDNARWWNTERYYYTSSVERQARFFDKLVDIRGDLEYRGAGFTGDFFGSWYRLWGVMLYRLDMVDEADVTRAHHTFKLSKWFKSKFADLKSAAVYTAEEYRKKLIHNDDDIGKLRVDLAGGSAASWLLRGLAHPELLRRYGISHDRCSHAGSFAKP